MAARARHSGFSLVEAMLAVTLFAVAFLLLVGAFPRAAEVLLQAQGYMVASHLAEQEMARLSAQPFSEIASGTSSVAMSSAQRGTPRLVTYTIQTVVTPLPRDLKKVQVVVSWSTGRGTRHADLQGTLAEVR